ncbi:MAG: hypothetical protein ABW106_11985 [Steroidobacteraceae bacterium]
MTDSQHADRRLMIEAARRAEDARLANGALDTSATGTHAAWNVHLETQSEQIDAALTLLEQTDLDGPQADAPLAAEER